MFFVLIYQEERVWMALIANYSYIILVYGMCDKIMLFLNVDIVGFKSNFNLKT